MRSCRLRILVVVLRTFHNQSCTSPPDYDMPCLKQRTTSQFCVYGFESQEISVCRRAPKLRESLAYAKNPYLRHPQRRRRQACLFSGRAGSSHPRCAALWSPLRQVILIHTGQYDVKYTFIEAIGVQVLSCAVNII